MLSLIGLIVLLKNCIWLLFDKETRIYKYRKNGWTIIDKIDYYIKVILGFMGYIILGYILITVLLLNIIF